MLDDFDPNSPVAVYYVSGDDYLDDPAWGILQLWAEALRSLASWLMLRGTRDGLSVVIDNRKTIWVGELLPRLFSVF